MKPSIQFLELIAKNPEKIFENYINKEINRRKNVSSIYDYVIENDDSSINESINEPINESTNVSTNVSTADKKKSSLMLEF